MNHQMKSGGERGRRVKSWHALIRAGKGADATQTTSETIGVLEYADDPEKTRAVAHFEPMLGWAPVPMSALSHADDQLRTCSRRYFGGAGIAGNTSRPRSAR